MQKEENYTLYSIKMIAAIAVVFIHCMFPGVLGLVVKNVARFAVPIFFIISGLFWNNPTLNRWEMVNVGKRRRKKVIHMAVYAFLVYIVAIFIINCVQGHLVDFFIPFLSIKNWIVFLLGNYPNPFLGIGHLWYLMAIIYVYNVVIFVEKRNCWLISYKISCCLIITIFIFEIVNVFTNVSIPVFIYRNWLVTGFPLFTLGRYLNDNKDELRKVSYTFLIVLYFCFLIVETILFKSEFELMPSSLLACLFLIKLSFEKKNTKFLSSCGKSLSSWVYVYHYLFIIVLRNLLGTFKDSRLLNYCLPLLVVILSVLFSLFTKKINAKIIK